MCRQNQVQYIHIYIYVYTWPIRSPCHEKAVKVLPFNGHWTWYGFLWQCFISCCHAYYNFSFGINLLTIYYVISYQYDQNNVNLCTSNCNRYIAFIRFRKDFVIWKPIHFSEFDDTERSKNYAPSLPSWMCSPVVAGSDCTELEAMAIPSSDTSTHQMKKEALLSNLHHRFKKDQIYVSNIIEMGKNAVLKIMI